MLPAEVIVARRNILVGLALSEHMGDVNDYLPRLAELLDEEKPIWCEGCDRYVWRFEENFDADHGHQYGYHEDEGL